MAPDPERKPSVEETKLTLASEKTEKIPGNHPNKDKLPPLTNKQRVLLVVMSIICFCTYITFAVIAPFFPGEAQRKGASLTEIGLIFGTYNIGIFTFSLVLGNFVSVIGPRFLYISGMFVRGGSDIIFGFLNRGPDGTVFVAMCFVVRATEALGTAMFLTAMWSIVSREFPDRVASTFGFLQVFIGSGLMLGPPVGGLLYDLGGFLLPFALLGGLMIFVAGISLLTMPKIPPDPVEQQIRRRKRWIFSLFAVPQISVDSLVIMLIFMPIVFYEISLEEHLKPFGLSSSVVGLMFTCETAAYALASVVWGRINRYNTHYRKQMVVGGILYSASCLLLGPAPWLPIGLHLWVIGVSLVLLGASASALNVATFSDLVAQAKKAGYPDTLETSGLTSGLYQFCLAFGAFLGPSIGSPLAEVGGFPWALSFFGYLCGGMTSIVTVIKILEYRRETKGLKDGDAISERMPLLKEVKISREEDT